MGAAGTLKLDIAILGGGFAGVYCGKSLGQAIKSIPDLKGGLISTENYMVFQPMLPEVAGASLSPRHVVNPVRLMCRHIAVYKATVKLIDIDNKALRMSPGDFTGDYTVRFKHLVLALGAEVDMSRVPGMSEHAFPMQNVGDAMRLRASVLARFEEANLVSDPDKRRSLLTFVIVGGGYSGVETAGQVLDLFRGINRYYTNVGPDDFHVYLIHSRDQLLPNLDGRLGKYAGEKLRERGLNILLERRVRALTANKVYLSDGTEIESNTVISTVGNAPHRTISALCEKAGLATDHGRIITTPEMQVPGFDWLWAVGDCAAVPKKDGGYCPSTAQFAMRQGALLGKNIKASLRNEPVRPFTFTGLGELAAIGHRKAVAEIFGCRFSGFFAWWLWRSIYLTKLPGFDRKVRVLFDWTLDLFFPRDITLLNPRYTRNLREMHLEQGDVLFHAGEPAFSFYVVRKGTIVIENRDGGLIKKVEAGGFFGERALLSDQTWRYTARASEESTLIALGSEEFKQIIGSSRSFSRLLERSATTYRSIAEIENVKRTLPEHILNRQVGNVMTTYSSTIDLSDPIHKAVHRINDARQNYYPVVNDRDRKVCGVLTRNDLYDFIKQKGLDEESRISDLQLIDPLTISPTDTVGRAIEVMVRGDFNILVVVDSKQRFKGILSIRRILEIASTK